MISDEFSVNKDHVKYTDNKICLLSHEIVSNYNCSKNATVHVILYQRTQLHGM